MRAISLGHSHEREERADQQRAERRGHLVCERGFLARCGGGGRVGVHGAVGVKGERSRRAGVGQRRGRWAGIGRDEFEKGLALGSDRLYPVDRQRATDEAQRGRGLEAGGRGEGGSRFPEDKSHLIVDTYVLDSQYECGACQTPTVTHGVRIRRAVGAVGASASAGIP